MSHAFYLQRPCLGDNAPLSGHRYDLQYETLFPSLHGMAGDLLTLQRNTLHPSIYPLSMVLTSVAIWQPMEFPACLWGGGR